MNDTPPVLPGAAAAAAPGPAPAIQVVSQSKIPLIIYVLYFIGFFIGLTAVAGVVLGHLNSNDQDPLVASHCRYLVRTFWWGLLMAIIGGASTPIFVGWFILLAWFIWTLVRLIKGLNALNQNKMMA